MIECKEMIKRPALSIKKRSLALLIALALLYFFPASAQTQSFTGYLNIVANENKSNEYSYRLVNQSTSYELIFPEAIRPQSAVYSEIQVNGIVDQQKILVETWSILNQAKTRLNNSSSSEAQGSQRINAFIVRDPSFINDIPSEYNIGSINGLLFSELGASLSNYLKELSKSKLLISGETYAPIEVDGFCAEENFFTRADLLLNHLVNTNQSEKINSTSRIIIFTPFACGNSQAAGQGSLGKYTSFINGSPVSLSVSMVYGYSSQSVINHEIGHNLGLGHDNYNLCGDNILLADCPSLEYGGIYNTMGITSYNASFNSINKFDLGWMHSSEYVTLDANNSINSEFEIYPLNDNHSDLKSIKIRRKSGGYYYIEYRYPEGVENYLQGGSLETSSVKSFIDFAGPVVYYNNDNYSRSSLLLEHNFTDLRNRDNDSINNAIYGSTIIKNIFYDRFDDIRIIPLTTTDDSSRFVVQANIDPNSDIELSFTVSQISSKNFSFNLNLDSSQVKKIIWNFGDGQSSNEIAPTHSFTRAGPITVTVSVIDSNNLIAESSQVIDVPNDPPSVDFISNKDKPNEGDLITFTSLATDTDGEVVQNLWSYDGSNPSTNASHSFAECGSHNVSLTAVDNLGASASITKSTFVAGEGCTDKWILDSFDERTYNDFPGHFTLLPYRFEIYPSENNSSPDRSNFVNYEWDLDGDGVFEYQSTSDYSYVKTFKEAGSKTVTVKATLDDGSSFNLSETFSVTAVLDLNRSEGGVISENQEEANIVKLHPKKATKVEFSIDNTSPWLLQVGVKAAPDYKKLVKFGKKKKSKKIYFRNSSAKALKFKIAPLKKLKKFLSPDAEGYYNIDLEFYGISYGADQSQRYKYQLKARP